MFRCIDKSSSGKTKNLMLEAKKNNGIFVCRNPNSFRNKAYNYNIVDLEIISYQDFLNLKYNSNSKFYIDELEEMLKELRIEGYNLSLEE